MLNRIEVDGFRSLRKFTFAIKPGLNILIGPNGAGKTNIITFFELLSHLTEIEVSDAIHRTGGVGNAVNSTDIGTKFIDIKIFGTTIDHGKSTRYIKYEYGCRITISEELGDIFYSHQEIKIRNTPYSYEINHNKTPIWDLHITSETQEDGSKSEVKVVRLDRRKFSALTGQRAYINIENVQDYFGRSNRSSLTNRSSILQAIEPVFGNARNIRNDLRSGEVFNIYPGAVREREDLSTPVGVQPDGSGTSATLLALRRLTRRATPRLDPLSSARRRLKMVRSTFIDIVSMLQIVNKSIANMEVDTSGTDGTISVEFEIYTDEGTIKVPLQKMSDGTAKWIALITAINTNRVMFAIEEPENYLHPQMQHSIIEIIRNAFSHGNSNSFALISTHSETLLNAANPDEIVVVSMEAGRTHVRRPEDPKSLAEVISETGFGLGSIYVSGALDHA